MKKTFIVLASLMVMAQAPYVSADIQRGKEYVEILNPQLAPNEVVEFFSFYCPHCYQFEYTFQLPAKIKQGIPKNTVFKQYHVDFLGRQSENLSRAWALAMLLDVTDKVKRPLFEATQTGKLRSMEDIRQIFIDNGVLATEFDEGINSFSVNNLVRKQAELAKQFAVRGVPDFYVNGKYRVNPEGLDRNKDFIASYVDTVRALLKK